MLGNKEEGVAIFRFFLFFWSKLIFIFILIIDPFIRQKKKKLAEKRHLIMLAMIQECKLLVVEVAVTVVKINIYFFFNLCECFCLCSLVDSPKIMIKLKRARDIEKQIICFEESFFSSLLPDPSAQNCFFFVGCSLVSTTRLIFFFFLCFLRRYWKLGSSWLLSKTPRSRKIRNCWSFVRYFFFSGFELPFLIVFFSLHTCTHTQCCWISIGTAQMHVLRSILMLRSTFTQIYIKREG